MIFGLLGPRIGLGRSRLFIWLLERKILDLCFLGQSTNQSCHHVPPTLLYCVVDFLGACVNFYFLNYIAWGYFLLILTLTSSLSYLVVRTWNILKELFEMESDFVNGVWQGPFWFPGWFHGIFASAWWCFYLCFRICSTRLKIYTIKLVYYEIIRLFFRLNIYIYI